MNETFEVSIKQDTNKDQLDQIIDNKQDILNYLEIKFHNKISEVFKMTKNELDELQGYVNNNNKSKIEELIRKNLIEDDFDKKETNENKEENNPTLDTLTIGIQSEKIEMMKIAIAGSIFEKLEKYNLTDSQKNNITIGIIAKILNKGDLENVFSGIGNQATVFIQNIENGDYSKAIDNGKNSINKLGKLNNILDNNMQDLLILIENKKDDLNSLEKLLSNPHAIELLNSKTNIDNIEDLKGEKLTNYLLDLNKKVIKLDDKIAGFEKIQSNIVDTISKSPDFIKKAAKGFLELLLKIPFIGEILAGLMGYKSAEKAIEGFGEELKYSKATHNLISHGKNKTINNLEITVLKDKDLSNLKYKKLKSFYQTCKKEGIDYTLDDFWYKLFNKKADSTKETKLYKLSESFDQNKINEHDFNNNQPKKSFYQKLNKLNIKKEPSNTPGTENQTDNINETALKEKREKLKLSMISKENLSESQNDFTDFAKLDKGDLEDLLNDISIEDLISDDYESKIKAQIGVDSGIDWIDENFNYDYESIKKLITNLRKRLRSLGKTKIEKIIKKTINQLTIKDIINKNNAIYKEIYKKELSEIKEINSKLGKKKEIKSIENSLSSLADGNINQIEYKFNDEKIKISFNKNNQEITIKGQKYKISLDLGYKLTNIEKKAGKISLKASIGGMSEKTKEMDITKFSNFLYELKSNGKIDLNDQSGNNIGKIEKE